jgi:hypothetical protein
MHHRVHRHLPWLRHDDLYCRVFPPFTCADGHRHMTPTSIIVFPSSRHFPPTCSSLNHSACSPSRHFPPTCSSLNHSAVCTAERCSRLRSRRRGCPALSFTFGNQFLKASSYPLSGLSHQIYRTILNYHDFHPFKSLCRNRQPLCLTLGQSCQPSVVIQGFR